MELLNDKLAGITESLGFLIPEIIVSGALLLVLLAGLFNNKAYALFKVVTVMAALASSFFLLVEGTPGLPVLGSMVRREGVGAFLTVLVDISVILTCLMTSGNAARKHASEYYSLLLAAALGCHLLLMTTNFLVAFVALEVISISSYVLAGYSFDRQGSEAMLKYFLFGSVASAAMLFGFSILYGLSGVLDFSSPVFFDSLIGNSSPLIAVAGLMGLSGFLFKMGAAPMHPWAPDVYQAAPLPVVAFLSVAPKLAGLGILTKYALGMHLFGQGATDWQIIIAAVSILTITMGNFSALWQKDPKRMMAYSSIAQSGFLLVGPAAFAPEGLHFMLFYGTVYLLMNFAVFSYLSSFEKHGITSLDSFAGTGKAFVWPAVGITVALVSLAGLPPTSGFTAKLFIFSGLWEAYEATRKPLLVWLLVFGLLNTVISLFYYLRIPYEAFLKAGAGGTAEKKPSPENLLAFVLVVLIVATFFLPGLLMSLINRINFVL